VSHAVNHRRVMLARVHETYTVHRKSALRTFLNYRRLIHPREALRWLPLPTAPERPSIPYIRTSYGKTFFQHLETSSRPFHNPTSGFHSAMKGSLGVVCLRTVPTRSPPLNVREKPTGRSPTEIPSSVTIPIESRHTCRAYLYRVRSILSSW
jgi:hypothetical protein